jgi:putative nucleotidyltransferase with HDIG domain
MRSIDVNEILSAFSLALDLAENKTFEHAQRTAYIALRVARELAVPEEELKDIYAAALLHDIGMVNALAEVHTDQALLEKHCLAGKEIVSSLPLSRNVSDYILWHHANWDGDGPFALSGHDIPLGGQIVYLADQLDLQLKSLSNIRIERLKITEYVKSFNGKKFSPDIVEAFLATQDKELFWLDYSHLSISEVISRIQPYNEIKVNIDETENIAQTFAKIIDNKSPFTHDHSQGVSLLLSLLSNDYQFDNETTKMLKISGLLHDLGKLAVPNEILDKPANLTPLELLTIKSHSYYTKLILSKVKEFDVIKEWAGNHHETLDGQGYPEGKKRLSKQERMVAICDVYQALMEERPYRKSLPKTKVFEIMGELVQKQKLCSETFEDLKRITS